MVTWKEVMSIAHIWWPPTWMWLPEVMMMRGGNNGLSINLTVLLSTWLPLLTLSAAASPVETMHALREPECCWESERMKFGVSSGRKNAAFDVLAIALASQSHGPADRRSLHQQNSAIGQQIWQDKGIRTHCWHRFLFVFISIQCGMANDPIMVPVVLEVLKCLFCFDAWISKSHLWGTSDPVHIAKEMVKHGFYS